MVDEAFKAFVGHDPARTRCAHFVGAASTGCAANGASPPCRTRLSLLLPLTRRACR